LRDSIAGRTGVQSGVRARDCPTERKKNQYVSKKGGAKKGCPTGAVRQRERRERKRAKGKSGTFPPAIQKEARVGVQKRPHTIPVLLANPRGKRTGTRD